MKKKQFGVFFVKHRVYISEFGGVFSEFFANFRCSAHFKSELRRNA